MNYRPSDNLIANLKIATGLIMRARASLPEDELLVGSYIPDAINLKTTPVTLEAVHRNSRLGRDNGDLAFHFCVAVRQPENQRLLVDTILNARQVLETCQNLNELSQKTDISNWNLHQLEAALAIRGILEHASTLGHVVGMRDDVIADLQKGTVDENKLAFLFKLPIAEVA